MAIWSAFVESSGSEGDSARLEMYCEGEHSEITRTVEIAKTSSHGYADLIVRTRETGTSSVGKGDACKDKITESKPVSTTLRYDGKSYVLPQGFKGL
jgi:hypothetical protein